MGTKLDALDELKCQIIVVQECAQRVALSFDGTAQWKGDFPHKGFGVFAFDGWTIEPMADPDPHPWLLPVRAISPNGEIQFTLLAVWTVKRARDGRPSYAGQLAASIDRYQSLLRTGPVVLAGDLNASAQLPKREEHQRNIAHLEALGVRSAFHHHRRLEHGEEEAMTLRWIGPGYKQHEFHCDFVFLSADLQQRIVGVEIGDMPSWVESKRSDHCPVVVELDLGSEQDVPVR